MNILFSTKDIKKVLLSEDMKGKNSLENLFNNFYDVPMEEAPGKIIDKRRISDEKNNFRLIDNSYGQFVFEPVSEIFIFSSSVVSSFRGPQAEPIYFAGNYINILEYRQEYKDWVMTRKFVVLDNVGLDVLEENRKNIQRIARTTKSYMNQFTAAILSKERIMELADNLEKQQGTKR